MMENNPFPTSYLERVRDFIVSHMVHLRLCGSVPFIIMKNGDIIEHGDKWSSEECKTIFKGYGDNLREVNFLIEKEREEDYARNEQLYRNKNR